MLGHSLDEALNLKGNAPCTCPTRCKIPVADNPLVTRDPHILFYAGIPLTLGDGSPVGTLCLLDRRARCLDESHLQLVRDLGKLVERELESPS
jgi:GAF domain-containing protein